MDPIQVIELEDHDDVNTIRDRLITAQSARVLLVIPWLRIRLTRSSTAWSRARTIPPSAVVMFLFP